MAYRYFVSFFASPSQKHEFSFGNCEIESKKKVKSIKDVREIENWIGENSKFKNASVLNYVYMGRV